MKYSILDGVVSYSLSPQEQAIYSSKTEELLIVNQSGALIWQYIQDGLTPDEIIVLIKKDHDDQSEEIIRKDLFYYLNELREKNFIYCSEE